MLDEPNYVDAAVLIALVWGGEPKVVLAATDHLNAGFAYYNDWVHACALLGQLGLLVANETMPSPTQAGKEIVARHCPSGTPPRLGSMKIRDVLSGLPIVAAPVLPPNESVIDEAIAAC